MRARREKGHLTLSLNQVESRILRHVLGEVQSHYQASSAPGDGKPAYIWYSTRGCETAGMTPEETKEWLANMRELKGTAAVALEKWGQQLASSPTTHCRLRLQFEEASLLLTALNDHRLLTASHCDIGQAEMNLDSLTAISHLPDSQRGALLQIRFLELVMSELLEILFDLQKEGPFLE